MSPTTYVFVEKSAKFQYFSDEKSALSGDMLSPGHKARSPVRV